MNWRYTHKLCRHRLAGNYEMLVAGLARYVEKQREEG